MYYFIFYIISLYVCIIILDFLMSNGLRDIIIIALITYTCINFIKHIVD